MSNVNDLRTSSKLKDSLVGNLQPQPYNGEPHKLKQFLTTFHMFYHVKGTIEWHNKELPTASAQKLIKLKHARVIDAQATEKGAPSANASTGSGTASIPLLSTETRTAPNPQSQAQPAAATMRVRCIKNDEQIGGLLLLSCTWKVQEVLSIYPVSYATLVEKLKFHYDRPTVFKVYDALGKLLNLKQGNNPLRKTRDELSIYLDKLLDYGIDFRTFHDGLFAKYVMLMAITDPVVFNQAMGFKCDNFEQFEDYINQLAQNERVQHRDHAHANTVQGDKRKQKHLPYNAPPSEKKERPANAKKWCTFHGTSTHDTKECKALKTKNNKNKKTHHANVAAEDDDDAVTLLAHAELAALTATNEHATPLMHQKVMIADSGANPSICSEGWIKKHKVYFRRKTSLTHDRLVRTAHGSWSSTYEVEIPTIYEGKLMVITVLVMKKDSICPLLMGNPSFIKGGAIWDLKTGEMELRDINVKLKWKLSPTAKLYYLPLVQPPVKECTRKGYALLAHEEEASTEATQEELGSMLAYVEELTSPDESVLSDGPPPLEDFDDESDYDDAIALNVNLYDDDTESTMDTLPAPVSIYGDDVDDVLDDAIIDEELDLATRLEVYTLIHMFDEDNGPKAKANVVIDPSNKEPTSEEIPVDILKGVIEALHQEVGHSGAEATYMALKPHVYGTEVEELVKQVCKACKTCKRVKHPTPAELFNGTLQGKAKQFNDIVAIDCVHYSPSNQGHTHVLALIDEKTGYSAHAPRNDMSAAHTLELFQQL